MAIKFTYSLALTWKVWNEGGSFRKVRDLKLLSKNMKNLKIKKKNSSSAKCLLYSDAVKGEPSPTGRGRRRSRDEKGNQGVGDFRLTNILHFFRLFSFFFSITLLYHFFSILFLPTTFTHTHDPRPTTSTHDPRPTTFSYTHRSVAKCRGSWVVGRGRGSWVVGVGVGKCRGWKKYWKKMIK